ncbi:MAG: hypothetical protein IPG39_16265 [Bacteroidetes bacterium]|nr:hypothetical protein [Bacteroidota bacterium]
MLGMSDHISYTLAAAGVMSQVCSWDLGSLCFLYLIRRIKKTLPFPDKQVGNCA